MKLDSPKAGSTLTHLPLLSLSLSYKGAQLRRRRRRVSVSHCVCGSAPILLCESECVLLYMKRARERERSRARRSAPGSIPSAYSIDQSSGQEGATPFIDNYDPRLSLAFFFFFSFFAFLLIIYPHCFLYRLPSHPPNLNLINIKSSAFLHIKYELAL